MTSIRGHLVDHRSHTTATGGFLVVLALRDPTGVVHEVVARDATAHLAASLLHVGVELAARCERSGQRLVATSVAVV